MKQPLYPCDLDAGSTTASLFPERMKRWITAHHGILSLFALRLPASPRAFTRRERRLGLLSVCAMIAAYTGVMFSYVYALQETEQTHAEDLGIMDQVLWNSAHGHFWHQTICNSISDLNCLGDVSRWAIHFEPLMIVLVPLYWLGAGPHVLQFIQVFGVALGALPAYWLGSQRLHHIGAGVLLALVYLTMPALASAVITDFHMVTLAAPLLMFALYFFYARKTPALIIVCLLAMGTKEQIALDVFMLGLAAGALQGRWRTGAWLMALAVGWAVMALIVIHLASPLGASPTAVRYGGLDATFERIPQLLSDAHRRAYLLAMLDNTKWVGIFAPWMLAMALPSILLNALSGDPNQYSAYYQYNADLVPFLLAAFLEGSIVLMALLSRLLAWWSVTPLRAKVARWRVHVPALAFSLPVMLGLNVSLPLHLGHVDALPTTWPVATSHTAEFHQVLRRIPSTASVTAQAEIVPHLSQRRAIYQFPDALNTAEYIVLDEDSDFYPEPSQQQYDSTVSMLLQSPAYLVLYDHDGFVLLVKVSATASVP